MPYRKTPLVKDHYYHVFNRGLNRQPTFTTPREYNRALTALWYYRFQNTPNSLHSFLGFPQDVRTSISENLERKDKRHIDVVSYCLMPNHFHLLLRQITNNGISKFLGNFQNSYTRYFNKRHNLQGSLFIPQFKAVLVETDEQLIHLSRYIHLNPFTSSLVMSPKNVIGYPYSSFSAILGKREDKIITKSNIVLSNFRSRRVYEKFVLNQADYQKRLHKIKHLLLEP